MQGENIIKPVLQVIVSTARYFLWQSVSDRGHFCAGFWLQPSFRCRRAEQSWCPLNFVLHDLGYVANISV